VDSRDFRQNPGLAEYRFAEVLKTDQNVENVINRVDERVQAIRNAELARAKSPAEIQAREERIKAAIRAERKVILSILST